MFFFHPFEIILIITGILTMTTSIFTLKKSRIPGIRFLSPLLFLLALWCFIDFSALLIFNIKFKLLMSELRYIVVSIVSFLFLFFSIDYSNTKLKVNRKVILLSLFFPFITTTLVLTNKFHLLMWKSYISTQNSSDIIFEHGLWFWFSVFYSFSLLFFSVFLLYKSLKKASQLYKVQLILIMGSLSFPIIYNIMFITASVSQSMYDLTPVSFSFTGLLIYFSISRLRMFDIIPVSKDLIVENMNEGVLILDENLAISNFNKKLCAILNIDTLESLASIVDKIPILNDMLKNNYNQKQELYLDYCQKDILLDISVLKDYSDRIIGKLIFVTDYTSQKEYEKNLKIEVEKAENANKAKSEFIANLSHEIRTPLNAIIGFSEIIEGKFNDHSLLHYFEGIKNSSRTLLGLINDILDLSKSEAGKITLNYTFCDITEIISSVRNIFSFEFSKKNIEFKVMINHNIPKYLYLDEIRLKQVLINVIGNAVKFTDKGSVIVEIIYEPYETSGKLFIRIKDTGIGIKDSQLEKIFEAFSQQDGQDNRKYGGTGLGLTITKHLIELMNGKIEVSSSLGKGSTFMIIFSNVSSRGEITTPKEAPKIPANLSFKGLKILYAEDNEMNRLVINGLLTHYNAEVIEAVNGKIAVEYAKSEVPDIILMDITMPVMDGLTATKLIRSDENLKHIPIIALTATIIESSTEEAIFDDIVNKPFKKDELLYKIFSNTSNKTIPICPNISIPKELHSEISSIFFEEIKRILSGIVMDDVLSLAEQIKKYSEDKNLNSLLIFSDELFENCKNYNIKKIRKSLEDFLKIC